MITRPTFKTWFKNIGNYHVQSAAYQAKQYAEK